MVECLIIINRSIPACGGRCVASSRSRALAHADAPHSQDTWLRIRGDPVVIRHMSAGRGCGGGGWGADSGGCGDARR